MQSLYITLFQMEYQASFHRCVIEERRHAQPVIFLVIPFIAIIVMYITMAFFLNKSGKNVLRDMREGEGQVSGRVGG